ncbi:hypothetical protein [Hymenobacter fodinae]|uniref:Uncharacterized protein n=1 Tax=Hymenobacter fodinae TaxID=2510796 RepID=A0A4Z0P0T7_9BACT|nr:hypothetical protein [Hymenobacter fodinae]TGE04208.1 hypothetical protein EU556_23345 [Hymenobacter fodinae]
MNYLELKWSADPRVVGVKDGLGPCYLDNDFYERHRWLEDIFINNKYDQLVDHTTWWKPLATMPDFGGNLERIPMEKAAKLTDFIDFSGFREGYLVNERLRDILEKAHLPQHKYFPATFQQGEREITGYWWLYYNLETGEHHVDFSRSSFQPDRFGKAEIKGGSIGYKLLH